MVENNRKQTKMSDEDRKIREEERARERARRLRHQKRVKQRNRRVAIGIAVILMVFLTGVFAAVRANKRAEEKAQQEYAKEQAKIKAEKEKKKKEEEKKRKEEEKKKNTWYLRLVNAKNPLDKENLPEIKTASINGSVYSVDERILDDLMDMLTDAYSEGRMPIVCSAYRSWETQEMLFQNKIARVKMEKGLTGEAAEREAATVVAEPGTSEHQLGLALDITAGNYTNLDEGQMKTEDQKWLMKNCWKYGFILRYPVDKKEITGVIFEPWHYRYVGKEAAKEITEKGITLEEYLGADAVGDPEA